MNVKATLACPNMNILKRFDIKLDTRRLEMKFIWSYEFDPDDAEKVSAKNRELDAEIERSPEKYPRLSPSYMTGLCEGFRIVEADKEEQLIRLAMHYFPEEEWEFTPIFEGAKVSEVYREMEK